MTDTIQRGALLSACNLFRYRLWRFWSHPSRNRLAFIMLNPSTADAAQDDPTIRKCIGFAKRLEYDGLEVVNLYAYRATKPADLKAAGWPKGPENDRHILDACKDSAAVLCAWGANARGMDRPRAVLELLRANGIQPMALALTDDGMPRHPLYIPYDVTPVPLGATALVTVCASCRRESCWQGMFYCENYRTAGTIDIPKAQAAPLPT